VIKVKKTVLLVDDVASNIDILLDILDDDYDVSVAMDGESALEFIAEEAPDIILLDIMMPGMSGYEVCERLKADAQTKHIPVIFVTARTDAANQSKGLALGAVDYIFKPVDPAEVKNKLNTCL